MCVYVCALPKFNMRSLKKRKTKYMYKGEREREKGDQTKRQGSIQRVLFPYVVGKKIEGEKETLSSMQRGWYRKREREKNFPPASVSRANEHSLPLFFSSFSLLSFSCFSPTFSRSIADIQGGIFDSRLNGNFIRSRSSASGG